MNGGSLEGGAITRSIRLLELLVERSPQSLSELARQAEVPVSSARRILLELHECGLVQREGRQYEISFKLLSLASRLLQRLRIPDVAGAYLEQLADEFQDTVFMAMYRKDELVYIDKRKGSMALQLDVEIGVSRPLYCTGLGKAMLACLNDEQFRRYLARVPLVPYTPNTLTTAEALREELARTRQRGYALDDEEILVGVRCVAAPILDLRGQPVAAISVAGAAHRFTPERCSEMSRRIVEAARAVSRRLGHAEGLESRKVSG